MKKLSVVLTEQEWIDVANLCQDGSAFYGARLANVIREQVLAHRSLMLSNEAE